MLLSLNLWPFTGRASEVKKKPQHDRRTSFRQDSRNFLHQQDLLMDQKDKELREGLISQSEWRAAREDYEHVKRSVGHH